MLEAFYVVGEQTKGSLSANTIDSILFEINSINEFQMENFNAKRYKALTGSFVTFASDIRL